MRHGRKSRTKRIDGYKRHIAIVDNLILATALEPANVREYEPTARLLKAVKRHGEIETLDIDRGYLASPAVAVLHRAGVTIHSRAWNTTNHGLFTKNDFRIQLARKRVICPNGASAPITNTRQVFFDAKDCGRCVLKSRCTNSSKRSLTIHPLEDLLIMLRADAKTGPGREQLRRRTVVEHRLARVGAIQGNRARYRGRRKNELDLNRSAALVNLFEIARHRAAQRFSSLAAHLAQSKQWRLVYWDGMRELRAREIVANAQLISRFGYRVIRPTLDASYWKALEDSALLRADLRTLAEHAPALATAITAQISH